MLRSAAEEARPGGNNSVDSKYHYSQNGSMTTCRHGHELTEDNTYYTADGKPHCGTCRAIGRLSLDKRNLVKYGIPIPDRHGSCEEKKFRKHRPGYVYVVESHMGYHKIGVTKDPSRRIRDLGVMSPVELKAKLVAPAEDMYWAESHLHGTFRDKRVKGEWFSLEQSDLDYIAGFLLGIPWT